MPYFPKSKINIKEALVGEFRYKNSKESFSGKYLELSTGRFYAGTDVINLGREIVKIAEESSNNVIGSDYDSQKFSILSPKKKKFLKNTKSIPSSKNIPTKKDYQRGYYTRYFARRINQPKGYIEINFDTVKKLQEKIDYDYHLYEVGSIIWALKNGTRKTNNSNLRLLEQTFPYISSLFTILNEFEIIDGPLNTTGGELYYEDGREYIGTYHIHPEKGPMVGSEHISEPHALLRFSDELRTPADDIETAIPRTIPMDVDYGDFDKFKKEQKLKRLQSLAQKNTLPSTSNTKGGGYSK
jgi:hypothetical protein